MNVEINANPLDYLIECCEDAVNTGYCRLTKFNILNAKDELDKLRQEIDRLKNQLIDCNRHC